MIYTIDIGNTRIKWASWQADKITARGVATYDGDKLEKSFDKLFSVITAPSESGLGSEQGPSRILVVCVAGNVVAAALNEWVKQRWKLNAEFLETEKQFNDVINAYDDPQQHGVDRWAAIVAGHQGYAGSSVCVISAGTAVTIDLVNKDGQHLGGYILPSYDIMRGALLSDTANVSSAYSLQFHKHSIPDNTSDAVNQGLHKLLQAGIREFCRFAEEKMGGPMQVILTGGFAKTILDYPDMPAMHHKPDLVMQGLYSIMTQNDDSTT